MSARFQRFAAGIKVGETVQEFVGGVDVTAGPDELCLQTGFGIARFVGAPGVRDIQDLRDILTAWLDTVA